MSNGWKWLLFFFGTVVFAVSPLSVLLVARQGSDLAWSGYYVFYTVPISACILAAGLVVMIVNASRAAKKKRAEIASSEQSN